LNNANSYESRWSIKQSTLEHQTKPPLLHLFMQYLDE